MKKYKRIYVEITNKCNKRCSFCSIDDKDKKEMSLTDFEHVLVNIKPYTDYIYLHVKGEPFVHSNIAGIFDLCIKYNIYINITTNGSLLYKHIDDINNCSRIRQINISLNSQNNIDDVIDIFKTVDKLNKRSDLSIVYRLWAMDKELSGIYLRIIDELSKYYYLSHEVVAKIYEMRNTKIGENIYVNKHELFVWPTLDNGVVGDCGKCLGTVSHVGILVDGTVIPCCLDSNGIISLGNVFKKSFVSIINSDRCKAISHGFKNNMIHEELCKRCSYRKVFDKNKNSYKDNL